MLVVCSELTLEQERQAEFTKKRAVGLYGMVCNAIELLLVAFLAVHIFLTNIAAAC